MIEFGPHAHALFAEKFRPVSERPLLGYFRKYLSMGNYTYYFRGDMGMQTRVFVQNYFRLLADRPVPAKWHMLCYSRTGALVAELEGAFKGDEETAVVELADQPALDTFGLVRVHVMPDDPERMLPFLHATVFYTEYFQPGTSHSILAHNLHIPAGHGPEHQRPSTGVLIPEGFRPSLYLGSGCNHHPLLHFACAQARVRVVNEAGVAREIQAPSMRPRACERIDLYDADPGLAAHIGGGICSITAIGKQFLAKPFLVLTDGERIVGEHL
jgi:hypothetical protein